MSLAQPLTLQRLPLTALGMVGGITRARASPARGGRHFSRRPARGEGLLLRCNNSSEYTCTLYVVGCALAPALPREQRIPFEALSL